MYTMYAFAANDLTLEANNQATLDGAPPPEGATATDGVKPAASLVGAADAGNNYVYAAAPIDNPVLNAAVGGIYAWNFGVLKQIESVVGNTGAAVELAALVLFSCPE